MVSQEERFKGILRFCWVEWGMVSPSVLTKYTEETSESESDSAPEQVLEVSEPPRSSPKKPVTSKKSINPDPAKKLVTKKERQPPSPPEEPLKKRRKKKSDEDLDDIFSAKPQSLPKPTVPTKKANTSQPPDDADDFFDSRGDKKRSRFLLSDLALMRDLSVSGVHGVLNPQIPIRPQDDRWCASLYGG